MATVKMEFTTWERTTLTQLLAPLRGDAGFIRMAVRILDKVMLTDEEKEEVGWKITKQAGPEGVTTSTTWENAKREWPVEFTTDEWLFLEERVKEKDKEADWPVSPLAVDLLDKVLPEG